MVLHCPVCNKTAAREINEEREFKLKGETFTIPVTQYSCDDCEEEFTLPGKQPDPLVELYARYRAKHNMMQPENIRAFRKLYDLTQAELSNLLGFGAATISRYERGCLQDEAHDKALKMAMDPAALRKLVVNSQGVFSEGKKAEVLKAIDGIDSKANILEQCVTDNFKNYAPNIESGFRKFDKNRFTELVLYFCREGVLKTKLNKLLFYTDFKHFKDNVVSITGSRYVHVPYGPAPDDYDLCYTILLLKNTIDLSERPVGNYIGEYYSAKRQPDLSMFNDEELKTMVYINQFFKNFTSTEISDKSHQEDAYKNSKPSDLISYDTAATLSV